MVFSDLILKNKSSALVRNALDSLFYSVNNFSRLELIIYLAKHELMAFGHAIEHFIKHTNYF